MTKTRVEIEHKVGRYGEGFYASMEYQDTLRSGAVELGPYSTVQAAEQAGDILAVMVAA